MYNKGSVVGKTLESVGRQTFTDYEVVIVNDASTDDSRAAVSAFLDKRPFPPQVEVRLLDQPRRGG